MAIDIKLEEMYFEDKKERESCDFENQKEVADLKKKTEARLSETKKMLPNLDVTEIWNCHYVAYLFHHGETTEDFRIAHEYAEKAVGLGSKVSRWLYAATLDRWLVSQGKKQKYGTQFKRVGGEWIQGPTEESTTDQERAEFFVPPLKEIRKSFENKYSLDN